MTSDEVMTELARVLDLPVRSRETKAATQVAVMLALVPCGTCRQTFMPIAMMIDGRLSSLFEGFLGGLWFGVM